MIVTHKLQTWQGSRLCYGIGEHALVKRASENTFLSLGWDAKWDDGVLIHYPGGWLDRANSVYWRNVNINPMTYVGRDCFKIALHQTNNTSVTLLKTSLYLKRDLFNKTKQEKRIQDFDRSFKHEFSKPKLAIVDNDAWPSLVQQHPILQCSPVWSEPHSLSAPAT